MSSGEPENRPSGASAQAQKPPSRESLPRRRRGYDVAATDALIEHLTAGRLELERECARLRLRVAGLETELSRVREREQLVSKALSAATAQATTIRENARREAEAVLSKAQAESKRRAERADRLERQRGEAERELERLRHLQRTVRTGLTDFLTQAVERLRSEQGAGGASAESLAPQSDDARFDVGLAPETPTAG
jgi:cell division septum initiation protein DivIVA